MIRFIAVMDQKQGLANEQGIPWQGKVPGDVKNFRAHTEHSNVLMGYRTYKEFSQPLSNRKNFVLSSKPEDLRDGFELVADLPKFIKNIKEDLWIIGGAAVFAQSLDYADELYITRLEGNFNCTKFFPPFKDQFELVKSDDPITENDITYRFQVWKRTKAFA